MAVKESEYKVGKSFVGKTNAFLSLGLGGIWVFKLSFLPLFVYTLQRQNIVEYVQANGLDRESIALAVGQLIPHMEMTIVHVS